MPEDQTKVLFLDIDGVLHPSTDVLDFVASGLPLLAYVQSRPYLLRWAPLLAQSLNDTACQIVVQSSWRNEVTDTELRSLFAASVLAARMIGSTPRSVAREEGILRVMALMGLPQDNVLILDDAVAEFHQLSARVAACHPLRGLSDRAVLDAVRRWAMRA